MRVTNVEKTSLKNVQFAAIHLNAKGINDLPTLIISDVRAIDDFVSYKRNADSKAYHLFGMTNAKIISQKLRSLGEKIMEPKHLEDVRFIISNFLKNDVKPVLSYAEIKKDLTDIEMRDFENLVQNGKASYDSKTKSLILSLPTGQKG